MDAHTAITTRPRPPADLVSMTGLMVDRFVPALDVLEWIRACYLSEHGALYGEHHQHLNDAGIGILWTNCPNSRHGKRVVGETELGQNVGARSGLWARARAEQQLLEWFGGTPDFIITLDALHADECDDATFAALIDHELEHAAQALDEYGSPKFDKITGKPKFALKAHDVSEFVSVVRRFGIEAAGPEAVDFVLAAAQPPELGRAKVAQACGNCLRLVA